MVNAVVEEEEEMVMTQAFSARPQGPLPENTAAAYVEPWEG